jgi:hypothetical protein
MLSAERRHLNMICDNADPIEAVSKGCSATLDAFRKPNSGDQIRRRYGVIAAFRLNGSCFCSDNRRGDQFLTDDITSAQLQLASSGGNQFSVGVLSLDSDSRIGPSWARRRLASWSQHA